MSDVTELPILPHAVGETFSCSTVACKIGDRLMLALPYRAGFGPSRGRRYRIAVRGLATGSTLVIVVGEQAMIPCPDASITEGDTVEVTLRVLAQRPTLRVPQDFIAALTAQGLTVDIVADHELNQLVTMIKEATDPAVRSDRIENAVAAVAAMTAARAGDVHDR